MSNIAFISMMEGCPWGGSEELWSRTALLLRRQGHEVTVNVKWWPETSWQVKKLQEAGCHVEQRHTDRRGIAQRAARKVIHRIGMPSRNWLDKSKLDFVVISQGDSYSGIDWAEQCHRRQIPYALVVQAGAEHWWPDDANAARAAKYYEAAAVSYFVSSGNLQLVRTQIATPLAGARVVRNPFNVSYDASETWPEEDGELRLACVGRLDPFAKGQDILFEVLKGDKWKQRRLKLSLYGDGQNSSTLRKLKDRYGLDNVQFSGFTSNVEDIWKHHHALILPSRYEGLPLALVEAMLCGRASIVTAVAGNAELLEDGVTGFIAAAPTRFHLDDAMERAWAQRGRLRQMGQLAGERVRQQVMRDPITAFGEELCQVIA